MNMEEEEFSTYGAFSSGCDIHGEDFLRECTMCGIEFCAACFPNSALCSDCAAQGDLDLEDEPPSEEDKELLLLGDLPDDEVEATETPLPAPPPGTKSVAPPKAKAVPKAKPAGKSKAGKAKVQPQPKVKPKAKPKAPPRAKAKPKQKAKAKPKVKTKPKVFPKHKAKATPARKPRKR